MRQAKTGKFEVLEAVVRLHVETGQPVPSSLVARSFGGRVSAATIRAVMLALEREGYLLQPHTSAGRVPTDDGYRVYVDRMLAVWPLVGWEAPRQLQRSIQERLRRSAETPVLSRVLVSLLNELTTNIGIILGPTWDAIRALRVDLYPKDGQRILMVLVLEHALVRSGVFITDQQYHPVVVEEAARVLSERVAGRTVAEIRSRVLPSLDAAASAAASCAADLAARGQDLFADLEAGELELDGVQNLLRQPEFADPENLKSLLQLLESPQRLRDALRRLSGEQEGLAIWIGSENPVGELRAFSLISSPFALRGRRGILAVLGPRRMPYSRAVSGITVLLANLKVLE